MWTCILILSVVVIGIYLYVNRDLMFLRLFFIICIEKQEGEAGVENFVARVLKFEPITPEDTKHFYKQLKWVKKKLKGNSENIFRSLLKKIIGENRRNNNSVGTRRIWRKFLMFVFCEAGNPQIPSLFIFILPTTPIT
ncbi:MAG: hypothetical protein KAS02_02620 [Candidatus Pacebacteria bacterium]|nr:hypothetical protein [Candidatus Paceibacterota bacterium]